LSITAKWGSLTADAAHEALAQVFREEAGRLTGSLVRMLGDFDLAEELVAEALLTALEAWPRAGIPANPGAWLMTAARNKALDRLRRERRYRDKLELLARQPPVGGSASEEDERLSLIFTCCHPALSREAQLALTLRAVGGLTTAEIARAFLLPEPTVAQRLVRAKRKIIDAGIPFKMPEPDAFPDRVAEVLTVLYLMFNEGYLSSSQRAERRDLSEEAEWLTALLARLMPEEPEVLALHALMRLHLARAAARFTPDGTLVLLRDQDRSRWDRGKIADGVRLLERAAAFGRPGPYQLQAAIAVIHAEAPSWEATDWLQILMLYDRLVEILPSPIVRLNRAIAVRYVLGPREALEGIEDLAEDLERYHLFHATRGELLRALGRADEARAADARALALTDNPAERALLEQRIRSH
jgi:RNA polymerase sigma-70 factor (ECF subfamily)